MEDLETVEVRQNALKSELGKRLLSDWETEFGDTRGVMGCKGHWHER